jgi:membrane-associated protein
MMAVAAGFLLALAESGLGLGAIMPGEMAISGLAAVASGPAATMSLGIAVAIGAVAGDHIGYLIGRHGGTRVRDSRIVATLGVARWDRAARLVKHHGFWAMFASRLLPAVRTVMPFVAGAAGLRYRWFLLASILGAITWSGLWVGAGSGVAAIGITDHPELLLGAGLLAVGVVAARKIVLRRRITA